MLDERDLLAIAKLMGETMEEKINASETRIMARMEERISATETKIMARMEERINATETKIMAHVEERINATEMKIKAHVEERIGATETKIKAHVDEKIGASEAKMREEIHDSESRTLALMEAYFEPRFKLLGEQLSLFQETKLSSGSLDKLDGRVDVLEVTVKRHSQDIETLKMAR